MHRLFLIGEFIYDGYILSLKKKLLTNSPLSTSFRNSRIYRAYQLSAGVVRYLHPRIYTFQRHLIKKMRTPLIQRSAFNIFLVTCQSSSLYTRGYLIGPGIYSKMVSIKLLLLLLLLFVSFFVAVVVVCFYFFSFQANYSFLLGLHEFLT